MKAKFLIPLFVLLAACNTANKPLTDSQKSVIKEEAGVVTKDMFNDLIKNDSVKIMEIMENSPDFTFVVSGDLYSYDAMKKMGNQMFQLIDKQTFDTKSEQYVIVNPTCFIYTWQGKNGVYMKSGESMIYDDYFLTYTFRKLEGKWKITSGHESYKTQKPVATVEEFTRVENDWNKAVLNKDSKTLELLYAKEYTYTSPTGEVSDKQKDIQEVTSGTYKLLAQPVLSDIKVNSFENVSIVTGINTVKSTYKGKDASGSYRFTDVFIMRDGRWQCVSTQSAILPKK